MRAVAATLILVLIAGCAPKSKFPDIDPSLAEEEARKQRIAVVEAQIRDHDRLWDVSFGIAASNVELCGDKVARQYGFRAVTLDGLDNAWKDAWRSALGVGNRPTVMIVADGSPASRAGLRPGDRLLGIGGVALGTGKQAMASAPVPEVDAPVAFTIERGGAERRLTVVPARVCDYPTTLVQEDKVNAFADGKAITISSGMLRFAADDAELALIVGHELAHNTRGHIDSKTGNMIIGGLLGAAASVLIGVNVTDLGAQAGAGAFSQEFEAEADYVGVYHAARAGFDVRKAASFWRRMSVAHPQGIHLAGTTHPSNAKRFLAVEKAAREVERKRAANLPLVPDER